MLVLALFVIYEFQKLVKLKHSLSVKKVMVTTISGNKNNNMVAGQQRATLHHSNSCPGINVNGWQQATNVATAAAAIAATNKSFSNKEAKERRNFNQVRHFLFLQKTHKVKSTFWVFFLTGNPIKQFHGVTSEDVVVLRNEKLK